MHGCGNDYRYMDGDLKIRFDENEQIFMEGAAKKVYIGEIELI